MKPSKKIEQLGLVNRLEIEMRIQHPQRGQKADYAGSRTAAIQLFCLSCMGGCRADVVTCKSFSCPLWQFRPGSKKGVRPPGIPTAAQYKEMIDKKVSDKQRAAGKKLREGDDGGGYKQ